MHVIFAQIEVLHGYTPNVLFKYQEDELIKVLLSPHSFKPRKNIPALVGTTQKEPECIEMRRTYAQ